MASRQELLDSIQPDMKLTKNFFMRIYGYEISFPGFAEIALTDMEKAGCSKARTYYQRFVGEYEKKHDEEIKTVAEWYRKQLDRKGDGTDWRKQHEAELRKEDLHQKSDRELLILLQKLRAENQL
ncbi:hypothetical protein [Blautia obeum]|uniref:hypothetical protein n=1 Tax=Blautia obeum TaxID=40520 RepID=UPI003CFCE54A